MHYNKLHQSIKVSNFYNSSSEPDQTIGSCCSYSCIQWYIDFLGLECWGVTKTFIWPEGCHANSLPAKVVSLSKGWLYTSTQQSLFGLLD